MTTTSNLTGLPSGVDIASIVAEVMRRLEVAELVKSFESQGTKVLTTSATTSLSLTDKVISVATVETIPGGIESVRIAGGIITPAARDELKRRGIAIDGQPTSPTKPTTGKRFIELHVDDDSREAITRQLAARGISHCPDATRRVVIADRPASALIEQIQSHRVAVLIPRLADIDRYAAEVSADTFVIDVKHFNWIGVINAVAAIARLPKSTEAVR